MKSNYTSHFYAGFLEASITHTFMEPTSHGILVSMQDAVSSYWQYLGAVILNDGEESLTPTQRRHYKICGELYELFEPIVADAYVSTLKALPRIYPCPVCNDEEPSTIDPDSAKPVDWEDYDEEEY